MSKAPDRGSFPLDHFHECDIEAEKYSKCVRKHQLMPKRCREAQVNYLKCRMNSGLMQEDEMSKLGFLEENSWQTEEAQKKTIFAKIQKMKEGAWKSAQIKMNNQKQNENDNIS